MLLEYTATVADEGKSVKQIIQREFNLSSRFFSKLKNTGGIKVNGVSVTVRRILASGEKLTLENVDEGS